VFVFVLLNLSFLSRKFKKRMGRTAQDTRLKDLATVINDKTFSEKIKLFEAQIMKYTKEKLIDFFGEDGDHKRAKDAQNLWATLPGTDDYGFSPIVSDMQNDENSTRNMLIKLKYYGLLSTHSAIELAAGTGRNTKKILSHIFDFVDVEEPSPTFLEKLYELKKKVKNVGTIYEQAGADFEFDKKYDFIFGQWFNVYLTDVELLKFLIKARDHLTQNGKFLFKEHIPLDNRIHYDWYKQKNRPLKVYHLFLDLVGLRPIYIKIADKYRKSVTPIMEILVEKDT